MGNDGKSRNKWGFTIVIVIWLLILAAIVVGAIIGVVIINNKNNEEGRFFRLYRSSMIGEHFFAHLNDLDGVRPYGYHKQLRRGPSQGDVTVRYCTVLYSICY